MAFTYDQLTFPAPPICALCKTFAVMKNSTWCYGCYATSKYPNPKPTIMLCARCQTAPASDNFIFCASCVPSQKCSNYCLNMCQTGSKFCTSCLSKKQTKCIYCNTNSRRPGHYSCQPCSQPVVVAAIPLCSKCNINETHAGYQLCNNCYTNSIVTPTPKKSLAVTAQVLNINYVRTRSHSECTFCGFNKKGYAKCPNCCR